MNLDKTLHPESGKLFIDDEGIAYAQIVDAELDSFVCLFNGNGCVQVNTEHEDWVTLTPQNLDLLQDLINEAEQHYAKNDSENEKQN